MVFSPQQGVEPGAEQELVVLEGGPAELPRQWAQPCGSLAAGQAVKVPHRDGYEHYQPTGERSREGDRLMPVYRWIRRTRIAE